MEIGWQKENLFNNGDISMFPYMLFLSESLVWGVCLKVFHFLKYF